MTTIHLLHGFNVLDRGAQTTGRLVPYFRDAGFATREHNYGWRGLLGARFCNHSLAERAAWAAKPGDIGCGHSNGCTILALAADLGAQFDGLVLINPALEADRRIAAHVRWVHVYYNRGDLAVWASELLDWLPWNWRRGHPWGEMGRRGYTGDDPRYRNFDCGLNEPRVSGHSAIFGGALHTWGPRIAFVARLDLTTRPAP